MQLETTKLAKSGHVATLSLNKIPSDNRINRRMATEIREVAMNITRDDNVWAVVIASSSDDFCLGTDLESCSTHNELAEFRVASSIASISKPVITALNGRVLDQGLELALACDIRIASENSIFGLTQVSDSIMPWDGGTQRLPRLIGRSRAIEWILLSRSLSGQEALDAGLINELVNQEASIISRSYQIAEKIVEHGPVAAQYIKEAIMKGADGTLSHGLLLEADLNIILQSTNDRAEGIRSFQEKRTPQYKGE